MVNDLASILASLGAEVEFAKVIVKNSQPTRVHATYPVKELDGIGALEDEVLNTAWGEILVELDDGRPVACQTEKHLKVE